MPFFRRVSLEESAGFHLFTRQDIPSIGHPGCIYIKRWRLIQIPWLGGIFLHCILEPDGDRDLHDHPWSFVSFILRGGYVEARPISGASQVFQLTTRRACSYAWRHAEDYHQVTKLLRVPTWTLLLVGSRKREWGFLTKSGWVNHKNYFRSRGWPRKREEGH